MVISQKEKLSALIRTTNAASLVCSKPTPKTVLMVCHRILKALRFHNALSTNVFCFANHRRHVVVEKIFRLAYASRMVSP
jgi:hypothetical protein